MSVLQDRGRQGSLQWDHSYSPAGDTCSPGTSGLSGTGRRGLLLRGRTDSQPPDIWQHCLVVCLFLCIVTCSLHRSVQEDRGHLGQLQWGHTHSRVGDIWSILFTIGVTNIFFTLINKYTVHLPATLTGLTDRTKLIRIFCSGITLASRLQTSEILRTFFFLRC